MQVTPAQTFLQHFCTDNRLLTTVTWISIQQAPEIQHILDPSSLRRPELPSLFLRLEIPSFLPVAHIENLVVILKNAFSLISETL